MSKRQKFIALSAFLLVVVAVLLNKLVFQPQEAAPPKERPESKRLVAYQEVKNQRLASEIPITGRVIPAQKVEIFAEVNGLLLPTTPNFKQGNVFQKGQTLIRIDQTEAAMEIIASRSELMTLILQALPDIEADFNDYFEEWEAYVGEVNVEKNLPSLPETDDKKFRYFLNARNIYPRFYQIKSAEARLAKYQIRAPFTGVLTETLIDPGTLVRSGQKLGTFISKGLFEVEASVDIQALPLLKVGQRVSLKSGKWQKNWEGEIARISDNIDPMTQSIKLFIEVEDKDLKEGMYISGAIQNDPFENAIRIERNLLIDGKKVYVIKDEQLATKEVQVLQFLGDQAIVDGLKDGDHLVTVMAASFYEGMPVKGEKNEPSVSGREAVQKDTAAAPQ